MAYRYKLLDQKVKNFMEQYRKEYPAENRLAGLMSYKIRFTKREAKRVLRELR